MAQGKRHKPTEESRKIVKSHSSWYYSSGHSFKATHKRGYCTKVLQGRIRRW